MASQNVNDVQGEFVTGWRGPTERPVLDFGKYLAALLPEYPITADHMSSVATWNGATNKLYGTCGPCSYANLIIMSYWYLTGELVTVTDEQIFAFYEASGNPNFNPQTHQGDNGVDNSVMLAAAQHTGLEITHADGSTEFIKAVAYGTLSGQNLIEQMRAATALFGGVLIGVMLEIAQQAQSHASYLELQLQPGVGWARHLRRKLLQPVGQRRAGNQLAQEGRHVGDVRRQSGAGSLCRPDSDHARPCPDHPGHRLEHAGS